MKVAPEARALASQGRRLRLRAGVWRLWVLLALEGCAGAVCSLPAAERWADERLAVTNGLELWFDASRQTAGRGSLQLPPLTAGNSVDYLLDGSGRRRHLAQASAAQRPRFRQEFTGAFLRFDGEDDSLGAEFVGASWTNVTVFVVAAPRGNGGAFRGLFGFSQAGRNDYTSGLNLDLGPVPTTQLAFINAEGAGMSGAVSLWSGAPVPFGGWHTFSLVCAPGEKGVRFHLDGAPRQARARKPSELRLDSLVLGARHYSNTPEPPHAQGFFQGDLGEVLFFSRALDERERGAVESYLGAKYGALIALPPAMVADGSRPLVPVTNPPPVQVLAPGFAVRELPVRLNNVNNVKYRADGKLVALGYNGRVYLLSDTDGDGLEDRVEPFWNQETVRAPIGLALTPPGYARGQGVFLAGKGKVSLIVDTNGDDRADQEIIVASWNEPSEQHGVDGLGVALDAGGNVYFSQGAASYTGAYLIDKTTGESRYSLQSERGTILKVSPDFKTREIVCTGIRFAVALAFNRDGDLFCTDQEGATWLANGNPLDELLQIRPGRHYGFPPRHPRHLPGVIDEPSVFDYAPQHESTCGLNFNEGVNGGPVFGPAWWRGDALVAGYSRGKLYRTRLVNTPAGYVAQNQLLAYLSALTVDACVSPHGDLVVATHSGQPDWGSGPNGQGRLYQIRFADSNAPQPVVAWSASPAEIRIGFDRPLEPARLRNLARQTSVTQGKFAFAGDRFETIRPGYQVVYDQLSAPRYDVPVLAAEVSADRRTIILATPPRHAAVNYAVTLPGVAAPGGPGELPQHATIDLVADLSGVEAQWRSEDGKANWSGWLPHLDLPVARALTAASAEQARLWPLLEQPGLLRLRGQLDLWQMLQPAIQPGSKLDYEPAEEEVTVQFASEADFSARVGTNGPGPVERERPALRDSKGRLNRATVTARPRAGQWLPFELTVRTTKAAPDLMVRWWTALDPRPRALPLRRFLLPWATPEAAPSPRPGARDIPELAGGSWLRGRKIYFSEGVACQKCHRVGGQGGDVGPDLSNLIHRDYASVLKDLREPSAAINPDHLAYNVELADGETFSAVLKADGRERLTFADASGHAIAVARDRIKSIQPSTVSLMPEGLLQALSAVETRDLMTFLLTSPLEPAPTEAPNPPPLRSREEVDRVLSAAGPSGASGSNAPAPVFEIVLCAGPKDHGPGEHDYPLWQKRWEKLLGLADGVRVKTADVWPSADQFKDANVIAFYSDNPGWTAERARELDAFLARGGGLVYLHYAVDGHKDVEALAGRIGLAWRGGASKFRHGALDLKLSSHPLAAGFGKLNFIDESYWQLVGDPGKVELLASGVEEGDAQPLVWTRTQGKGRVFVSILGHYSWTFDDPLFRILVLRGICWAGGQPMDRLAELCTIGARTKESQ